MKLDIYTSRIRRLFLNSQNPTFGYISSGENPSHMTWQRRAGTVETTVLLRVEQLSQLLTALRLSVFAICGVSK